MSKRRFFGIALLPAVVAGAVYGIPVLARSGHPWRLAWAIARLELTPAPVVPVTANQTELVQKRGPEAALSTYLAARGWTFRDRLGGGIVYENGAESLLVQAQPLTSRYVVYRLSRTP